MRTVFVIVIVVFLLALPLEFANAAAFSYSDVQKQIKAGVIAGHTRPSVSAFYVFHVMSKRQDLKPASWDFYNPLAPTHVTRDVIDRWGGSVYREGQTVTKDMGCYWEVVLSKLSFEDIAKFDVLFLPMSGGVTFEPDEREKLRKFVDSGGVLWIENDGGGRFLNLTVRRFFILDLQFSTANETGKLPLVAPPTARTHSVLNRPFSLSWMDVNKVGFLGPSSTRVPYIRGQSAGSPPDPRYFSSVLVSSDGKPVLTVAQYGSGHVVVVAVPVGLAIAEPVGVANNGGLCGDMFMVAQPEDLKLAYNIVSLGTEHTTFQKCSRHIGYSFGQISAPLATLWEFPTAAPGPTCSSPAILDDVVFYVDAGGTLHAFELYPGRDRDGDGNPDDGIPDSLGAPYDELWNVNVGGPASTPTVAYIPSAGGVSIPVVFVTVQSGQVISVNALTGESEVAIGDPMAGFGSDLSGRLDIPAPTYFDGVVYSVDGVGYTHARDYFTGVTWLNPDPASRQTMGGGWSPTVGYYYDAASGATEQVLYVAKRGIPQQGDFSVDGTISTYPVKVFNEMLLPVDPNNQPGLYRTRAPSTPILDQAGSYRLYYIKPDSGIQVVPLDKVVPNPANQRGRFQIEPQYFQDVITINSTILADYMLDYTQQNVGPRQQIPIMHPKQPDGSPIVPSEGKGMTGAPAASKTDILYFGTENGNLYAMRDSVRGNEPTVVMWRWCLKGAAIGFGENAVPVGTPAVADDMVYFAVNDGVGGKILALRADPVFSITLSQPIRRGSPVTVRQWDTMSGREIRFSSSAADDSGNIPRNVNFVVGYDSGRLTFLNFRNGDIDLSAGHDLMVDFIPEDQEQFVTETHPAFNAIPGDKWNNLVWFMNIGHPITTSPVVMGNVLYVGCGDGYLVSLDVAKIGRGRTGPGDQVDPVEAKNKGMFWAEPLTGNGPIWAAPAGSHGLLAVSTAEGLVVLHSPVTLIADGNRLVELDTGGRVVWSCDSTSEVVETSEAQTSGIGKQVYGILKVPFNRPAVAKRAMTGGLVVADTGNNRVVHIDTGGNILWKITSFVDFGPDDANPERRHKLPAGSPLTLNRPTDVEMWMVQPAPDTYPEYHYLVADSGNCRVLEITARYDPASNKYRNELDWVSGTFAHGKEYRFETARRVYDPVTDGPAVVCVVSSMVREEDVYQPGGALVKFTNIGTPEEEYSVYTGLPLEPGAQPVRQFDKPTFFSRYFKSNNEYSDVVIADGAVHVVDYVEGVPSPRVPFTQADYRDPVDLEKTVPFAPVYAQILPNGNVLVTNKATIGGSDFKGEVVEIAGGAGRPWEIVSRVGQGSSNSYGLRQPSSAERSF